jgi:hypothetical protein
MSKKREQGSLGELVRRHGVPQSPKVDILVSEVRSCLVATSPPPVKPEPDGILGGMVVMWEFSIPLSNVQDFHDFLRQNETFISTSIGKLTKSAASYRGTYMQYAPGDPRYRTIWAYESLEAMGKAWSDALRNRNSNFYKAVRQLRAFWLCDPLRSEARWVPGRYFYDRDKDFGDAFAKLTLDALNSSPTPPIRAKTAR